jgi:hypothetical protein
MKRAVCGGLAALPVLCWTGPAAAATTGETSVELGVQSSAWTWRQALPGVEPSNVPTGDLPVQFDGRPDAPPAKATYLRLDLTALPAGASLSSLTLTLPLDPAVSQDASTAPLVACRLTGPLVPGEGVAPESEPAEDCTGAPTGRYDGKGAVSFTLTAFARTWLTDGNNGVVVRPDPTAALPAVLPFQLSFQGPTSVTALATVVVPPTAPVVEPVLPPPATAPGPDVPSVAVAPALQPPVPAPAPAPQVVAPQVHEVAPAVPAAVVPVVRTTSIRAAGRASAAGFALAGAAFAVLLALVGWCFGEAADPRVVARAERRRLDRLRMPVPLPAQPRQIPQGRKPFASAASTVTYS